MPWLYYRKNVEDVLESDKVQMEVTFDPDNNEGKVFEFQYKLAVYNLDGSFNDFIDLTDQLILCPHSSGDAEKFKDFGTNIIYDCNLDLEPFITADPTVFYELFF
jgi:hypothetical protein